MDIVERFKIGRQLERAQVKRVWLEGLMLFMLFPSTIIGFIVTRMASPLWQWVGGGVAVAFSVGALVILLRVHRRIAHLRGMLE